MGNSFCLWKGYLELTRFVIFNEKICRILKNKFCCCTTQRRWSLLLVTLEFNISWSIGYEKKVFKVYTAIVTNTDFFSDIIYNQNLCLVIKVTSIYHLEDRRWPSEGSCMPLWLPGNEKGNEKQRPLLYKEKKSKNLLPFFLKLDLRFKSKFEVSNAFLL